MSLEYPRDLLSYGWKLAPWFRLSRVQDDALPAATARKIGVHPVFLRQKVANLGIDAKNIKDESAEA